VSIEERPGNSANPAKKTNLSPHSRKAKFALRDFRELMVPRGRIGHNPPQTKALFVLKLVA
jgi:hypothetical protein